VGRKHTRRHRQNLRPAPFSITPAIVRAVLELTSRPQPALVQVPILPIKLVDRPRRSEDPRLAMANDDDGCAPSPAKLDLNNVPSAMERLAESWRREKTDG